MTVTTALCEIEEMLSAAGVQAPLADAELLVGHVLGVSRGRVQALGMLGERLSEAAQAALFGLAAERARRVPLQHLTGRAPFRNIELSVGPGVFVPRPETETVVDFALDALDALEGRAADRQETGGLQAGVQSQDDARHTTRVVDLCTGSGAIALAIAHERSTAQVWAVEKSAEAHAWATRNVAEWGEGRVQLVLGDVAALDPATAGAAWKEPVARTGTAAAASLDDIFALAGTVDVLVSNPPYVPSDMVPRDPEVRDHDPALALYSGADGLDLIRVISRIGLSLVRDGGSLVLEHAEQQGSAIRMLLAADGWLAAETFPDLTGRDRTTTAVRPTAD